MRLDVDVNGRRHVVEGRGTVGFAMGDVEHDFAIVTRLERLPLPVELHGTYSVLELTIDRSAIVRLLRAQVEVVRHPPTVTIRGRLWSGATPLPAPRAAGHRAPRS